MATILDLMKNPAPVESNARLLRDSLVEFVATTVFVFAGTCSAVSTGVFQDDAGGSTVVARILPIAMTFGITILALAHGIGHLTGGHMNPGVTLLMFLRRQVSATKLTTYWIAQFAGGILGALLTWGATSGMASRDTINDLPFKLGSTTLNSDLTTGNGFLMEFMGSFLFYFVIAQTALDKRGIATTAFPAIPIGLVLIAVHVCLIPFTGCGVNPARTFGPSMVACMTDSAVCKKVAGSWYWIYFVGPFAAAFVVAEITTYMSWELEEERNADDASNGTQDVEAKERALKKLDDDIEEDARA